MLILTPGGKLSQKVLQVASPALRHDSDAGAADRIHCCCGREIKEKILPELSARAGVDHLFPYFADGSESKPGFGDFISWMICSISAGLTTNGFFGKCFMLPVTRYESSTERATS